jgi:glycosyltransferase involved in cell wall biosynthesis
MQQQFDSVGATGKTEIVLKRKGPLMQMARFQKIMVGIPAWNAERTVGSVVSSARKYVHNVVVLDDGSTDLTEKISEAAGATVKQHKRNQGYGAALRSIFEHARSENVDVLVILDADGQHDANEIPIVLGPVVSGKADIAIGSRFVPNREAIIPLYRLMGIKLLNIATSFIGPKVADSQSGFRAYSRKAIDVIHPTQNGMSAGAEILIQGYNKNLTFAEVPINCSYEVEGSTQNPVYQGVSILVDLVVQILSRPTASKVESKKR